MTSGYPRGDLGALLGRGGGSQVVPWEGAVLWIWRGALVHLGGVRVEGVRVWDPPAPQRSGAKL